MSLNTAITPWNISFFSRAQRSLLRLALLKCNLFRLIFCSWMRNPRHRSLWHNIYSLKYFQILFRMMEVAKCRQQRQAERGGEPDTGRSRGRIATSYLPLPRFLPSDGNNWYCAETNLCIFIYSTSNEFMSKKICSHGQKTQDSDERWGGSAVR